MHENWEQADTLFEQICSSTFPLFIYDTLFVADIM
jgi:hypothetical protein